MLVFKLNEMHYLGYMPNSQGAAEVLPLDNHQGQRQGHVLPWTEKTVPMSAEEDVDKEHVLYARM